MNIIIAILGFGFLVLVHELGHFWLARANGVKVEEFSVGMGPTIISHKGKETVWSIKALPIGGACQMKGEDTGKEDGSSDSFQSKSPLRRMSIIAAGPIMNIITAVVLFAVFGFARGYETNGVKMVVPDSPAMKAGLLPGDKILSVGSYKTGTFVDVLTGIYFSGGKEQVFKVDRGGKIEELKITPVLDPERGSYIVGFSADRIEKPGVFQAVRLGTAEMISLAKQTVYSIGGIVTGKVSRDNLAGPVAVIGTAAKTVGLGLTSFLKFLGLISISLAVFNLLPLPALDGGWLLLLTGELVSGKKIPEKAIMVWNGVGFALLISLMLFVTYKDIFLSPR